MADIYPPTRQREALRKLAEAVGCRDVALRRDEVGDWRASSASSATSMRFLERSTARGVEGFQIGRTYAKRALSFCEVTNERRRGENAVPRPTADRREGGDHPREGSGVPKKREESHPSMGMM